MRSKSKTKNNVFRSVAFLTFFTLVTGCSKDSATPDAFCYPSKVTTDRNNTSVAVSMTCTFNGSNLLSTVRMNYDLGVAMDLSVEYNDKGSISKMSMLMDGAVNPAICQFQYDSDNRLVSYYLDAVLRAELEYNVNGQMSILKVYGGQDHWEQYLIEYEDKTSVNPYRSRLQLIDGKNPPEERLKIMNYEYDNKKTPYGDLGPFWLLFNLAYGNDWENAALLFAVNNATKLNVIFQGKSYLVQERTYEYNDNGFPVKIGRRNVNGYSTDQVERYEYLCK